MHCIIQNTSLKKIENLLFFKTKFFTHKYLDLESLKGSKNKYEIDKSTGLIKLDRAMKTSQDYPFDILLILKNCDIIKRILSRSKNQEVC